MRKSDSQITAGEIELDSLTRNIMREKILAYILICIIFLLLCIDIYAASYLKQPIFAEFSNLHILLLLIAVLFLVLVRWKGQVERSSVNYFKSLHLALNFLVLNICSLLAITSESLPFPFIIAIFSIASLNLLKASERMVVFLSAFCLYGAGTLAKSVTSSYSTADLIFVTLLVMLGMLVSQQNYAAYTAGFLQNKVILDKNAEITKLNQEIENALQRSQEELYKIREFDKLRVSFFANISHELRTPLTIIYSSEQMLELILKRENVQDLNLNMYVNLLKQNCFRLTRLINNLIDITKIDAGYFRADFKNCELVKLIRDISSSLQNYVENQGLRFRFDSKVTEKVVACDPELIERIVLNLLSNAVKFTPRGGEISLLISESGEYLNFSVKDTGIGIPEELRGLIFERFVQAENIVSGLKQGSGIGLALVKALVDMHDGSIELISELGKGSEFIIKIPLLVKDEAPLSARANGDFEKINTEFAEIIN